MNPMLAQYSAKQHSQCGYRPQTSFSPVKCFIILFFFYVRRETGINIEGRQNLLDKVDKFCQMTQPPPPPLHNDLNLPGAILSSTQFFFLNSSTHICPLGPFFKQIVSFLRSQDVVSADRCVSFFKTIQGLYVKMWPLL